MKKLIYIIIALGMFTTSCGQEIEIDTVSITEHEEVMLEAIDSYVMEGNEGDLINSSGTYVTMDKIRICEERGHVESEMSWTTDMHCEPYVEDTEHASFIVYPACNHRTYYCLRCNQKIIELEPEYRVEIWRVLTGSILISDSATMWGEWSDLVAEDTSDVVYDFQDSPVTDTVNIEYIE